MYSSKAGIALLSTYTVLPVSVRVHLKFLPPFTFWSPQLPQATRSPSAALAVVAVSVSIVTAASIVAARCVITLNVFLNIIISLLFVVVDYRFLMVLGSPLSGCKNNSYFWNSQIFLALGV